MKKRIAILFALLLACCCAALAEEPNVHYEIDLSLEIPEASAGLAAKINEALTVTAVNTGDRSWNELCFRDLMAGVIAEDNSRSDAPSGYTSGILQARCDGERLDVRTDPDDPSVVRVSLPAPVDPGERAVLEMTYAADVPMGGYRSGGFPLTQSSPGDGRLTLELGHFYPMLAVMENGEWVCDPYITAGECAYSECADYDISLTVPEGYQVVASGDEEKRASGGGLATWQIRARRMRDVTLIVSNEYKSISGAAGSVAVNCYYACEDTPTDAHALQGQLSLEAAQRAVALFSGLFGEYPYGELDVVESCYEYGGMEAPGLVRISQLYSWFIDGEDAQDRTEYRSRLAGTVAHEVAHEWFYGLVGNDQYNEAWLDESFAAYCEQLYWRDAGRSEADIAAQMDEYASEIPSGGDETVDRSYGELTGGDDFDYTSAVYHRGAAFLYRLEQAMGRESFHALLKEYCAAYSFRVAHTGDFLRLLTPRIAENPAALDLVARYLKESFPRQS